VGIGVELAIGVGDILVQHESFIPHLSESGKAHLLFSQIKFGKQLESTLQLEPQRCLDAHE
jgi:hypothetical protein